MIFSISYAIIITDLEFVVRGLKIISIQSWTHSQRDVYYYLKKHILRDKKAISKNSFHEKNSSIMGKLFTEHKLFCSMRMKTIAEGTSWSVSTTNNVIRSLLKAKALEIANQAECLRKNRNGKIKKNVKGNFSNHANIYVLGEKIFKRETMKEKDFKEWFYIDKKPEFSKDPVRWTCPKPIIVEFDKEKDLKERSNWFKVAYIPAEKRKTREEIRDVLFSKKPGGFTEYEKEFVFRECPKRQTLEEHREILFGKPIRTEKYEDQPETKDLLAKVKKILGIE